MSEVIWMLIFWSAAGLLFLAYPGYPLVLRLLARQRSVPPVADSSLSVSAVLVVRNEETRIEPRLRNLLDCAIPLHEVIVVCDGCTDATAIIARSINNPAVRIIEMTEPKGKPAGVNLGVQSANADVVVLCDARQRFEPETIPRLVRWFMDSTTGAVSGALEIDAATSASGQGVDAYWRLEKFIRQSESDLDSCIGCTGAVYAVRRASFQLLPEDIILDDVVVPMLIAHTGQRVRFDASARAFDPQTLDGAVEQRRKLRTLAGNFQMLARYPRWVLPGGHRLWLPLILHKYLRLTGPALMAIAVVTSLVLAHHALFFLAAITQGFFYTLAIVGFVSRGRLGKTLALPAGFVLLQWCVVRGFAFWLTNNQRGGWR